MHIGNGLEVLHAVFRQLLLMALDGIEADGFDVVDGFGETVGGNIVRGTGLELKGQSLEGGLLPRHLVNHLASTLIWWKLFEPFLFAIEHTDARGTVHLMAAESEEVAVHRLHVNLEMGSTLGAIDHHGDAMGMGDLGNLGDRVYGSEDITDMGDADELGAFGKACCDVIAAN